MSSSQDPELWPAPVADGPVSGVVRVPGSKSVTNRALILAALANSASTLRAPLKARDTRLMASALSALGTEFEEVDSDWVVRPQPLTGPAQVDCGLAGTVMRFVPPVAALAEGRVRFDGDPRARVRPMAAILDALRQLGIEVEDDGRGTLPFTLNGKGSVTGGEVTIDASASSQFVSALLLAGARYDQGVRINHDGGPLPSLPHIDMSVQMLRERGVWVDVDIESSYRASWTVHPGEIRGAELTVEPDLSNALPFIAAAMATGGAVTIPDWPASTTQPGGEVPNLMRQLGGTCRLDADGLTVSGPQQLTGLDVDLSAVGELTPVLAALCALASTRSSLRGIGHLRGHETDRLTALATELNRAGGKVVELADGLEITPAPLHGCRFETYDDHRMATAGAVLGLVVPGIEVVDIETTSKTLPEFARLWLELLGSR